jgi:hypothetical protein
MTKRAFQLQEYKDEAVKHHKDCLCASCEDSRKLASKRPKRDGGFCVGDTLRMPHYETSGGFRVWQVHGVHLGATYQESSYHLIPVEIHENEKLHVPCIILETHPEIERL